MFTAVDEMNALIYGETQPGVVNYIKNQYEQLKNIIAEPAKAFFHKGYEIFERAHGNAAIDFARNVLKRTMQDTSITVDAIIPMYDVRQIQNAGYIMQRWIMANPTVRQMYIDQKCDGFSGTYINTQGATVEQDHYDYRRVMNNVVVDNDDGSWVARQYSEDLYCGDRELTLLEKNDILHTWTALDIAMAIAKDDPTSAVGGHL